MFTDVFIPYINLYLKDIAVQTIVTYLYHISNMYLIESILDFKRIGHIHSL